MSSIILVRLLTKDEYGSYAYALNLFNIFMLLSGAGATSAILQLCSEHYSDRCKRDRFYRYGCRYGISFNVLICAGIALTALLIPLPLGGSNALLGLMTLLPLCILSFELQTTFLRVELRNRAFAYASTGNAVILLAYSVCGALVLGASGLISGRLVAFLVSIICIALLLKAPLYFKKTNLVDQEKKEFKSIAIVSACTNGMSQIAYFAGIFIVGIMLRNAGQTAAYQVATTIPLALGFIPSALVTFLYPYFARHRHDSAWVLVNFKKSMLGLGTLSLFISIIFIVCARPLILLIFGNQYYDSVVPFQILMAGFAFISTLRTLTGNLLVTQRKITFNFAMSIVASLSTVVLTVAFVTTMGIAGAALAQVIAMVLTGIVSTFYFVHAVASNQKP